MDFQKRQIICYPLEGMTAIYTIRDGVMSFTCVPEGTAGNIKERKLYKSFNSAHPYPEIEPMVQIARTGNSPRRDFSAGATLYDSSTAFSFIPYNQQVFEDESKREIITLLKNSDGLKARHILTQRKGYKAAELRTEIENEGEETTIELASSFAISALTPFEEENDPETLVLHCLQSNWSGEGRKESTPVSHFNFEDSWSSLGVRIHKIGVVGSMPARGYIPFMALEDKKNSVTWAVQTEAPDSWQIEALHRYGGITLTGGHADYLFGHWRKKLGKGEVFCTHSVFFTAVKGDLTKACAALTKYQETRYNLPLSENSLPVIYNEYLYSWGNPTMENLRPQMKAARSLGAEYFVVDAGWFCESWDSQLGDWEVPKTRFPKGLKEFSSELEREGFKAGGLWYEFEGVTALSEISKRRDLLLKEDGLVIDHGGRMFFDFRKKEVTEYLKRRVIDTLNENKIKYIKIDYNENIGMGADGAESPGEGLRLHIERVVEFFKALRNAVPELVMEICSSGGMRHEPLFQTLGSMVSFSDAHENFDGAVVAADLHRVMQPRTMQIWASILSEYTPDEVYFTMVKAMLGRICLSGNILTASEKILSIVRSGVEYYQTIKEIIRDGETVLIDTDEITSLRHPKGLVRLARKSADGDRLLCYAFSYNERERTVEFPSEEYRFVSSYGNVEIVERDGTVRISLGEKPLCAAIMLFEKENSTKGKRK